MTDPTTDLMAEGFFDEFYPRLFGFIAQQNGAPRADVEELAQETLFLAWRDRAQFRGEGSLDSWILGIAKNQIRRRRRGGKLKPYPLETAEILAKIDAQEFPEKAFEDEGLVAQVRQIMEEIGEDYSFVLMRKYYDHRALKEIAEECGESEAAIASRLQRAREAFRQAAKRRTDRGTEQ